MGAILVTGGRGFLGSHLVRQLRGLGETVRILARPGAGEGWAGARPQAKGQAPAADDPQVVWGDIRDARAVERAVEGAEVVMHLVSNFRKAGTDGQAHGINVDGTDHVLRACERHGVKQLIHCSTIGVHGDVRTIPADEQTPFNPGDRYQQTKLLAEQRVWDRAKASGLPVTVIRPISMFGPGDLRMLKLFRLIRQGRFVMFGQGTALFQPAYIDDVVAGFLLCLRNPKAFGEAFIVGGEDYVPLNELVRLIAVELHVAPPTLRLPLAPMQWVAACVETVCAPLGIEPPLHRRRLSFFKNNRAFRIEKAKRVLGFRPQVSLLEGIRRTIRWYEEHGYLEPVNGRRLVGADR